MRSTEKTVTTYEYIHDYILRNTYSYQPCFDLVAELVHLGQLPLAATPQRYRLTLTHPSLDSEQPLR